MLTGYFCSIIDKAAFALVITIVVSFFIGLFCAGEGYVSHNDKLKTVSFVLLATTIVAGILFVAIPGKEFMCQ